MAAGPERVEAGAQHGGRGIGGDEERGIAVRIVDGHDAAPHHGHGLSQGAMRVRGHQIGRQVREEEPPVDTPEQAVARSLVGDGAHGEPASSS